MQLPVKFVCVIAGYCDHSIGIAYEDGSLWVWGSNNEGQLGLVQQFMRLAPVRIPNTRNFVNVAAGNKFTLCLDSNGNMWSFGRNNSGQLGIFLIYSFESYVCANSINITKVWGTLKT
jgi:alpha-tubulin suppressor-like RCC1 family protein